MIPRQLQGKRTVYGVVAAVVIWALFFYSGSFLGAPASVVYVDSATGQVLAQKPQQVAEKPPVQENAPVQKPQDSSWVAQEQGTAPGDCVIPGPRANATFVTLARNSELYDLVKAIRNVEDRFNRKFHYDWVFLNDEPFTDEFKRVTGSIVSGTAKYGLVPKEHWSYPDWIDQSKAAASRKKMKEEGIIYGDLESYRHMCRYESGFFWRHPLMNEYEWYWRVEPGIQIHCDLDYDLFRYMEENNKVYGFTITIHEFIKTIPTLWDRTKEFLKAHPEHVAENNLMEFISEDKGETYNLCHFWSNFENNNMAWISDDNGNTYNGCHFWSNFEVAAMKLWQSEAYLKYFEYLDKAGGFFYERWGDAPVHSIGASLFIPKDKIHFFGDVGYFHVPFNNCPVDEETRLSKKCVCNPKDDFTWRGYSCTPKFFKVHGLTRPKGWENFTQ
ncbi:putative glycolipid 2-alpha-mannosyltransferase [Clavispora lusitaniae]|uniref:Glycolipid 2-alpha-mannosyltransferase n=1 Tax=Clavispora lusitaniae TaxID=36911 RepID=A0ACD0WIJ4_CLALS|nr:putative glycolipid 2-alpha-mannosyltransferase [Clavispora lusitaniae]QFZ32555.1 putative glycolipid 2-alpha-mannosyltransferase [Clavispora lusitaniae]QFZ38224.1 putative glycolipid 2-alpha-mannosyltransferase [Clavispora lusitaniae]QFZ43907.1 putative glycolipid 2-alpha-mannosyltransferase [Clavispora lusitaniae]QFZ49584.1 putative glycolipid 2-alpha-mannosyltransferase [Clavispora lusitaniae]